MILEILNITWSDKKYVIRDCNYILIKERPCN